jgi:signal transduction histidine kinase
VQVLFPEVVIEAHKELSLMVDLGQLEQALINLIKNALEASAKNTTVKVLWQERSRELEIAIIDSGTGITNPDNLFVPFYSTKESGSGIGLLLSRDLIRNQGGELSLKNRIDDVGAIAKITLPIFEE